MPGTESNNLVIWGEELGTSSPGGKGDGVIGYDTPHADRIAGDGVPFTAPYVESSCTLGRSAFVTALGTAIAAAFVQTVRALPPHQRAAGLSTDRAIAATRALAPAGPVRPTPNGST